MKIIIDNSNLFAGGGIQVAASFLNDLNEIKDGNLYYVIQSPNSAKSIKNSNFSKNFTFYELESNTYSSKRRRKEEVLKIEENIKPDCIFTTFGPSYHKSKYPKIVGFAFGQMIYEDSPFFKKMSLFERLKYKVVIHLKKTLFLRNSDVLIFESEDARLKFNKITRDKIPTYTVSNTLNSVFRYREKWRDNQIIKSQYDILCVSANYKHKNLNIIPKVIDNLLLLNNKLNFKFHISLNKEELNFDSKYDQYINYFGTVQLEDLPMIYSKMDVLFMPTLLETFSTTYLEAMFMKVPIVTSNLGFAKDICGDAALFCSPLDSLMYAEQLLLLYSNPLQREILISQGISNLDRFGTSMDRTNKYIHIIKEYSRNGN